MFVLIGIFAVGAVIAQRSSSPVGSASFIPHRLFIRRPSWADRHLSLAVHHRADPGLNLERSRSIGVGAQGARNFLPDQCRAATRFFDVGNPGGSRKSDKYLIVKTSVGREEFRELKNEDRARAGRAKALRDEGGVNDFTGARGGAVRAVRKFGLILGFLISWAVRSAAGGFEAPHDR